VNHSQQVDAARAFAQVEVADHDVRVCGRNQLDCSRRGCARAHKEPLLREIVGDELARKRIILYKKDL
jgi:hypothetical protein